MASAARGEPERLRALERALVAQADDLALYFVFDRPERASERPGLARTYFAQRCVSDEQLGLMIDAFRSVGAYVELFEGERPFIDALTSGRLQRMPQGLKIAYNGIGWGVGIDGFKPGRKSLLPLVADAYGVLCANSDAHACAVSLHKFHSSLILEALGVRTPRTWHYRATNGWIGGRPPDGTRVIAKSTYEAWSVGVRTDSVFFVDRSTDTRVAAISRDIGQAVTVQQFIPGREVCVPVVSCPEPVVTPIMEAVIARAPDDPDAIMTIDDNLNKGSVSHRLFDAASGLHRELEAAAVAVFDAFGLQGLTRVDFRVDEDGEPWVFDVAVDPGVGVRSSAFLSMSQLGLDHPSFLRAAIAATLAAEGHLRV